MQSSLYKKREVKLFNIMSFYLTMEYKIFTLPSLYQKIILKLSLEEQERIRNINQNLTNNPYVGDQLQIKYLREKRLNGKRLYYFIFEDLKSVLIVAISDKKTQQKTIDLLFLKINEYREYVRNLLDGLS